MYALRIAVEDRRDGEDSTRLHCASPDSTIAMRHASVITKLRVSVSRWTLARRFGSQELLAGFDSPLGSPVGVRAGGWIWDPSLTFSLARSPARARQHGVESFAFAQNRSRYSRNHFQVLASAYLSEWRHPVDLLCYQWQSARRGVTGCMKSPPFRAWSRRGVKYF